MANREVNGKEVGMVKGLDIDYVEAATRIQHFIFIV